MATAKASPSAIDVARYLVRVASVGEDPQPLTPLHIQKLVYYVQGWFLAYRGEPMFSEKIEAWTYGPAVRQVYQTFKRFSGGAIDPKEGSDGNLTEEQKEFIRRVWATYNKHSAVSLTKMTHGEDPWKEARGKTPPGERSGAIITTASLKKYFSKLAGKR